ncbi:MAG: hypothetical protein OQK12_16800 [Motiliproteus sp.]|nr:hypothetical protein [Motiliproteus sp.]MCW9051249.1 hypothetical protein [Motiliproteus sp.]
MSFGHFDAAMAFVLPFEGRGKASEDDRGGETDYGISLRFLKSLPDLEGDLNKDGHVTALDIYALEPAIVKYLYRKYFWTHYGLLNIQNEAIAIRAFSFFVNMRGKQAAKVVQRACRAAGFDIQADGILGPKSFRAINSAKQVALISSIRSEAAAVYRMICQADKTQNKHLKGWLNRAYA